MEFCVHFNMITCFAFDEFDCVKNSYLEEILPIVKKGGELNFVMAPIIDSLLGLERIISNLLNSNFK